MSTPTSSTRPTSTLLDPDREDPVINFTSTQALFKAINSVSGDVLFVRNVSPESFTKIEKTRTIRRRRIRWCRYDAEAQLLVIAIPTGVHETLHLELYYSGYVPQLVAMGRLWHTWSSMGASYCRSNHPGGAGGGVEADSSGGPKPQRLGRDHWPTLAIEAGESESLDQLRADMRWWFSSSNHDVKIVLLAKFDRRQSKIILEKWEEQAATRQGATTTRLAATPQPVLQQAITITRDATTPVSYNVTGGALLLEFRLLFLRDPDPLESESDVVMSVDFLQQYAEMVWCQV